MSMHDTPTRAARGVVEFRFRDDTGFWIEQKYYSKVYDASSNGAMYHTNQFARKIEGGGQVRCSDGKFHHGKDIIFVRKYKEISEEWKEI